MKKKPAFAYAKTTGAAAVGRIQSNRPGADLRLSFQASTIHFQHFFEKIKEMCYNIKRNRDTGNGPPLRFSVGPLFAYDRA